jgi:hypothetical protein
MQEAPTPWLPRGRSNGAERSSLNVRNVRLGRVAIDSLASLAKESGASILIIVLWRFYIQTLSYMILTLHKIANPAENTGLALHRTTVEAVTICKRQRLQQSRREHGLNLYRSRLNEYDCCLYSVPRTAGLRHVVCKAAWARSE